MIKRLALAVLVCLPVAVSCENGSDPEAPGASRTPARFVGTWSGQAGGLSIVLHLHLATCEICCGGDGGYSYTFNPDGIQGTSAEGAQYLWCEGASNDSLYFNVLDAVNQASITLVVAPAAEDTLQGRWSGGAVLAGHAAKIALARQ